jgi:hypothetical protein
MGLARRILGVNLLFEEMPEGARRVLRVIEKNAGPEALRMKDLMFALDAVEREIQRYEAQLSRAPEQRVPYVSELQQFKSYRSDLISRMRIASPTPERVHGVRSIRVVRQA